MADLSHAQLQTLKGVILAETDPIVTTALSIGAHGAIADWYNVDASPNYYVWKLAVTVEEYRAAMVWTDVGALLAGPARIWEWITARMTLPINASDSNIRQGIADAFGAGTTTRTNLLAIAKRFATKAEKALVTSGTGTTGDPGVLGWEGKLSGLDIRHALEA